MAVHLVVDFHNGTTRYYPVPEDQSWKIDTMQRMIVIGRGVPRTHIPLDTVASFDIEDCGHGQQDPKED